MECVPGNLPGDLVLLTWAASAQHVPKLQICRKKTSAQHKHCRHSEALLSLRESFISASEWFIIQVPRLQPRPALPAGLSKDPILGWPWELFLKRGFWSLSRAHGWGSETHGVFPHVTHSRAEKVRPQPPVDRLWAERCPLTSWPPPWGPVSPAQSQWQLDRVFSKGESKHTSKNLTFARRS